MGCVKMQTEEEKMKKMFPRPSSFSNRAGSFIRQSARGSGILTPASINQSEADTEAEAEEEEATGFLSGVTKSIWGDSKDTAGQSVSENISMGAGAGMSRRDTEFDETN